MSDRKLDAQIAKELMGHNVVGWGWYNDNGEGAIIAKAGETGYGEVGPLMVDYKCSCDSFKGHEPDDIIHGHHRWCLTPVPNYSRAWCGDFMSALSALREKSLSVSIYLTATQENKGVCNPFCLVTIEHMGSGQGPYYQCVEKELPLALCKAALLAVRRTPNMVDNENP